MFIYEEKEERNFLYTTVDITFPTIGKSTKDFRNKTLLKVEFRFFLNIIQGRSEDREL